jgi:hypothetical protein
LGTVQCHTYLYDIIIIIMALLRRLTSTDLVNRLIFLIVAVLMRASHEEIHAANTPIVRPTLRPTPRPSTPPHPSLRPTAQPTAAPTAAATATPVAPPTSPPTIVPTEAPTSAPTAVSTVSPTQFPSVRPTAGQISAQPSAEPSRCPTFSPSASPTFGPSPPPSSYPTIFSASNKLPADVLNLTCWYLQLPISETGEDDSPWFVTTAELQTFSDAYFYVGAHGGVVFRTPVWGVHTSGSQYPRSELRETKNGKNIDWYPSAYRLSSLSAALEVNEVPSMTSSGTNAQVVIGQIKGSGSGSSTTTALVIMWYRYIPTAQAGYVTAQVALDPAAAVSTYYTFASTSNVRLNQSLSYDLMLTSDSVTGLLSLAITVNGETVNRALSTSWSVNSVYFKAGCYIKANSGVATGFGQVTVYGLNLTHVV